MGSLQDLVRWVRGRTSKKKKPIGVDRSKSEDRRKLPLEAKHRTSTRSSLYGFHRPDAQERIAKEQICENALYPKTSVPGRVTPSKRVSPLRLYNDSPAHIYEEIPGCLVKADIQLNEERNRLNFNLNNLNFAEAKEVGPYLVVPIRKQKLMPGGHNEVGLIKTKDLVDVVHSTENLADTRQTLLEDTTTTQLCSRRKYTSHSHGDLISATMLDSSVSDLEATTYAPVTQQVVADIHRSVEDSPSEQQEAYIHCKKCKRPHGIYKEDFMEHYESDDNVFEEPDLIKDSQVKGQGHSVVREDQGDPEYLDDTDESVYGIREQIYSTTDELQNDTYVCSKCASKELTSPMPEENPTERQEKNTYTKTSVGDHMKIYRKLPNWKKYVSMGTKGKRHSQSSERTPTQTLDIPNAISYSTVSTRLSPNTQLLLDGRHYKTLPIDIVTPVKPSGVKKPFGYDKLDLSKSKAFPKSRFQSQSQYTMTESNSLGVQLETDKPERKEMPILVPRFRCQITDESTPNVKPRSASCSDILDEDVFSAHSDPIRNQENSTKPRNVSRSVSDECEYISMAQGSSPRENNSSFAKSELSPSGIAMQRKKAKILKSIAKNRSKESQTTPAQSGAANGGNPKQKSDRDIYNCDAETKRKVHDLTRNKLSSTWNGPRPPPKGANLALTRHSTLPHSFSPNPNSMEAPPSGPLPKRTVTRSSDTLLLPKQLSSKDFHTLNRNSGFPGSLYLKQGGIQGKLKGQMLKRRKFASSSDCLLSSTIAEESGSGSGGSEPASGGRPERGLHSRSQSYDASAQTYTNAAAIVRNQGCAYRRRHNPILSDLMRVNNDRQTLMLI